VFKFIVDVWNKLFLWFLSIKCNPSICEWLLFKLVWIHLIYECICLYVVGVWIAGVVYEFWMKLWKCEFLVKNVFHVEFVVKWCCEFMFANVLIDFWCMLTNNKVWITFLGQRGSKSGFLWKFGMSTREEPKILGSRLWWARLASYVVPCRVAQDRTQDFGRCGKLGPFSDIPKCFFWCVWLLFSLKKNY